MKILLNVSIPGEPKAQERHRWGKGHVYDPSAPDKDKFLWDLRAAVPALRPNLTARIGVRLHVHTRSLVEDIDNYLKFYMDALSPKRMKKRLPKLFRQQVLEQSFAVWGNDNQIDDVKITVDRGAADPRIEIFAYELEKNGLPSAHEAAATE